MVRKTVSYETQSRPGPWQRRLHLIAGAPNFNPQIDALINTFAAGLFANGIPQAYEVTMTHGQTGSAYCYPPERFEERVIELFDQGALFIAYVGHGQPDAAMPVTGFAQGKIMDRETVRRVQCPAESRPVAFFIACDMARFDGPEDSVAEAAVKAEGGPVAVVGSARFSHPYGNAILGMELMAALLDGREPTLGRCLLKAQNRVAAPVPLYDLVRQGIDGASGLPEPVRRRELNAHVYLYNLLGDPGLRVAHPREPMVEARATPSADGTGWRVTARTPGMAHGEALVRLEAPRARIAGSLEPVHPDKPGWADAMRRNYETANRKTLFEARVRIEEGRIAAEIPASACAGPGGGEGCLIKMFAWNERGSAAAVIPAPRLTIRPGAGAALVGLPEKRADAATGVQRRLF